MGGEKAGDENTTAARNGKRAAGVNLGARISTIVFFGVICVVLSSDDRELVFALTTAQVVVLLRGDHHELDEALRGAV